MIKGNTFTIILSPYAQSVLANHSEVLIHGTQLMDWWAHSIEATVDAATKANANLTADNIYNDMHVMMKDFTLNMEASNKSAIENMQVKLHESGLATHSEIMKMITNMQAKVHESGLATQSEMMKMITNCNNVVTRTLQQLDMSGLSANLTKTLTAAIEKGRTQDNTQAVLSKEIQSIQRLLSNEMSSMRVNHNDLKKTVQSLPCAFKDPMVAHIAHDVDELVKSIDKHLRVREDNLGMLQSELKGLVNVKDMCAKQLSQLPVITGDMMTRFTDSNNIMMNQIIRNVTDIMTKMETAVKKVEDMQIVRSTNKHKGMEGEQKLFDKLTDHLAIKDSTFQVHKVNSQAHNGDMMVSCTGRESVRLEIKAHENKVGSRDINKFVNDLIAVNSHGILISLHNGIVGKSDTIDIEQMANGKFAIYLSNNNYDVYSIANMLDLIHGLTKYTKEKASGSHLISISPEVMQIVRQMLKDVGGELDQAVTQLKSVLAGLSKIKVEQILNLLLGQSGSSSAIQQQQPNRCTTRGIKFEKNGECYTCPNCNTGTFKSLKGAQKHYRRCVQVQLQDPK